MITRLDMRRRNVGLTIIALIIVLLVAGSAAPQTPTDYFPASEWRTAKPKKQGLNKKILKSLASRLRTNQIRDLNSLIIVRNGYLVVEEYFNGSGPEDVHTLQSDSKSVTSLLVGIALRQGRIQSVDDKVVSFFPEYEPIKRFDERKAALSIRDLLTMRTGLDWSEDDYNTSPLKELNECGCDWLRFVLNWRMREMPGSRFEYNSGGVILLGGIIRSVAGRAVDSFAEQYLFSPLGIRGARWFQGLPEGLPHMGGGLNLRATDMARIGYLLLRNGRWGDQQIVSHEWLQESTRHWVSYPRALGSHSVDYGYLWWLLPVDSTSPSQGDGADIYTAAGARDQWIFVIPKYDMVVVVTGNTSTTFAQPVDFLYTDILRAVE